MRTVDSYTDADNTATYYVDVYGDIFDNEEEAEVCGIDGKVIVDGFYIGSSDEMRAAALEKYIAAKK